MTALTTLAAAKQYLGVTSQGSDPLITRLIPSASSLVQNFCSRIFPITSYSGLLMDGSGSDTLVLPDYPIISVSSLTVDGVSIPAASSMQSTGYVSDDKAIFLASGQRIRRGRRNVQVSFQAGYRQTVQAVIPAGNSPALLVQDPGSPSTIYSITQASGTAMTSTANSPASGQYQFAPPQINFAAADAGTSISIDMAFIPAAVEQACIEVVGLAVKRRDNLGIRSKTLAQETISFDMSAINTSAVQALQPYRRVAPT